MLLKLRLLGVTSKFCEMLLSINTTGVENRSATRMGKQLSGC
jgi:hypothetical protein